MFKYLTCLLFVAFCVLSGANNSSSSLAYGSNMKILPPVVAAVNVGRLPSNTPTHTVPSRIWSVNLKVNAGVRGIV